MHKMGAATTSPPPPLPRCQMCFLLSINVNVSYSARPKVPARGGGGRATTYFLVLFAPPPMFPLSLKWAF